MEKQPRNRPSRRFADAKRLIIPCDRQTCLHCGQPLTPRKTWYVKKYVQTLDGPVFVAGKSNRCVNPACPHPAATYYASGVLSISLPYSTYGLDVLAESALAARARSLPIGRKRARVAATRVAGERTHRWQAVSTIPRVARRHDHPP